MISSQQKNELRERLLAAESTSRPLRLEYERKVSAMYELHVTAVRRSILIGLMIISLVLSAGVIVLVLTESLPPRVNAALLSGAGFTLAWTVFFFQMLVRGTYRSRIEGVFGAGMKLVFALIMFILLAAAGIKADDIVPVAIFIAVPAGLFVVYLIVNRAEMRTQERLVELEYRLATLGERLGGEDDNLGAGVPR